MVIIVVVIVIISLEVLNPMHVLMTQVVVIQDKNLNVKQAIKE